MRREQDKTLFLTAVGLLVLFCVFLGLWFRRREEARYDRQILAAAERYRIDPALIKAVIWRESRFNPRARGKAGEIGLMQVREDAAFEWADAERLRGFSHEQITDPEKNIRCGTFYLSKLLKRYPNADDPLPYALADYNAGRGNVLRWNKGPAQTNSTAFLAQMDFPGTRDYAQRIMQRRSSYIGDFKSRQLALR